MIEVIQFHGQEVKIEYQESTIIPLYLGYNAKPLPCVTCKVRLTLENQPFEGFGESLNKEASLSIALQDLGQRLLETNRIVIEATEVVEKALNDLRLCRERRDIAIKFLKTIKDSYE